MTKKVAISARPKQNQNADAWVDMRPREPESKLRLKPKRLTIDIDPGLHSRLKIHVAKNDIRISDLLRTLIERELDLQDA